MISQTNININNIKRRIHHLKTDLENSLSKEDFTSFMHRQRNRIKSFNNNINTKQNLKLDTLKEKQFKTFGFKFNNDFFENKTDINIPTESKWILSLGKKFAIPINQQNFSPINTIADIEQYIQSIEDNGDKEKEVARTILANNITKFKKNTKNSPREKFILTIYNKTKEFLKKHKNIIITQADKGNRTVALYKNEYKIKMKALLDDKNTYRKLRTDPTMKLQKENNKMILELFMNKHIDDWQKRKLLCTASVAPRIYGLPKIHKPEIPLRPIVSSVQVPCYNLSKYIGQILKNIISNEYNITNSINLKEQLNNVKLDNGEILISLDVVSLFTNIPINKAIAIIMKKWDIVKSFTKIPKTTFIKILRFCIIDNNYFIYNEDIYSQIFGMPMGNPLSPTIANIILDDLLDESITKLKNNNIKIKYITKYVDDILAIVKIDEKDEILNTFNLYHKKLQFTMEVEKHNSIAFLDTKLHRKDCSIDFNWYKKDTASGRIVNFYSTQPKYQIINTAKNFIHKVLTISDNKFHTENIKLITNILKNNSYPTKLIKSLIDEIIRKITFRNINDKNKNREQKIFYSVRYIPKLTDKRKMQNIIENKNISFAYKPNMSLSTLFTKLKAPIKKQQENNVVYEIKCNGNKNNKCNMIYIGTTKRSLETRLKEHKNDTEKRKQSTALAQHMLEMNHTADFDNVKILDKENNEKKRYTIESLRIQQKKERTMNLKEDTDNISANYRVAIK